MCGTRVDKARSFFVDKYVVETGLVAADAGVDLVRALLHCLLHEERVRQKGSRHAHHVRLAYTVHQINNNKISQQFQILNGKRINKVFLPPAMMPSAVSGLLMRFVVHKGILTSPKIRREKTKEKVHLC